MQSTWSGIAGNRIPVPGVQNRSAISRDSVRLLGLIVAKRLARRTVVVVGGGLTVDRPGHRRCGARTGCRASRRRRSARAFATRRTALGTATGQHAELAARDLHLAALA